MNDSLLLELLCEELPPKALKKLGDEFARQLYDGLQRQGFLTPDSRATAFATPRRLALRITQVRPVSPDAPKREKVLPLAVAFNAQGQPQPPLLKKLAALGLSEADLPQLKRESDGKAEALFYDSIAPGQALDAVLPELVQGALTQLPIPKVMSYQLADMSTVHFVRPVHRLVALHGARVLPLQVLGLTAGNATLGHRFLSQGDIMIRHADAYESALEAHGKVVASFTERRARIEQQLQRHAQGEVVIMPDALLDEVTALVEWPVVLEGHFDAEFLEVPQECLILTMQLNQKYFAVANAQGQLQARFLLVSNLETQDSRLIVGGNERVLRARLADAKFFYDQDRKQRLDTRLDGLKSIVYHNKLGSLAQRVERLVKISGYVAQKLGADLQQTQRAARLLKCDLLTGMVGEFPELQGLMGAYYARHDGESASVARAIEVQYQARPPLADMHDQLVASTYLAERAEVLVGIWGIGLQPTGEKDPFALRRAALGLIDAYVALGAQAQALPLRDLLEFARSVFHVELPTSCLDEIVGFIYERCRHALAAQFDRAAVDAVISLQPPLQEVAKRVEAVLAFAALPEAQSLAAANKRISNILKKTEADAAVSVTVQWLQEKAEQVLHAELHQIKPRAEQQFSRGDYSASLQALAALRPSVDAFFNEVMVMAEDASLRANRIALLRELHGLMNRVADLSKLAA
jgi:glycyl-tRNA synthetase beta chain